MSYHNMIICYFIGSESWLAMVIFLLDWGVKKRALLSAQKEPKSEKKGRDLKFQTKTENYQLAMIFLPNT